MTAPETAELRELLNRCKMYPTENPLAFVRDGLVAVGELHAKWPEVLEKLEALEVLANRIATWHLEERSGVEDEFGGLECPLCAARSAYPDTPAPALNNRVEPNAQGMRVPTAEFRAEFEAWEMRRKVLAANALVHEPGCTLMLARKVMWSK